MTTTTKRIERKSTLQWISVDAIETTDLSQRRLRPWKANRIAAHFDPDKLGIPVVSLRDGRYWIVDGQHRIEALRIMGWNDQQVECEVYEGLTDVEEAEFFLGLNDSMPVQAYERFLVGLTAQRPRELAIARAAEREGLVIASAKSDAIMCVSTLVRVYDRIGEKQLGRVLRILDTAYGVGAMYAGLIEGMGLVVHRYDGQLKDEKAIEVLEERGVTKLRHLAEQFRHQTGRTVAHCTAAAIVKTINSKQGVANTKGSKLPNWWA